jgi:MFS family permease
VPRAKPQKTAEVAHALFDFRPVFRNRSAMAYAIAYCLHTLEMSALRGWGVAFLGFVAMSTNAKDAVLSPAATLTALGLIGTLASVVGNEGSIYFGRRVLISVAMLGSATLAGLIGLVGTQSYTIAVALMLLYGLVIWLDSSSLTAGTAGSAEPSRRGATLAVHSTLGYLGGFVGPLAVGWILDHGGANTVEAWRNAFMMIAGVMLAGFVAFAVMRPRNLAGDRTTS